MRFFTLLLAASCLTAVGQCEPDFSFGEVEFGLSPNPALGEPFENGVVGEPYVEILHVLTPSSTDDIPDLPLPDGFPTLPFDSLTVNSMSLIGEQGESIALEDIGLSLSPNNNGDSGNPLAFLGGGQYCAALEGVPDSAGFYLASLNVTGYVTILFGPFGQDFPFEGFTLTVTATDMPGCMDVTACNYDEEATSDNFSCLQPDECGVCGGTGIAEGACDCDGNVLDALGTCGGDCLEDIDANGICDSEQTGGIILFQETFSNGFDGSNGNGAWSVDQNVETDIWVWVAPGNTGYFADGTPTGVSHPAGAYSFNQGALESTTASDGWMIFDNDYFHGGVITADNPAIDTEGSLTSPLLDFSSNASIIVNWESYFRYCCFPDAPILLEVGTIEDGVTSWTSFDGHGNFIESANAQSANPLPVGVDVSCAAANQDSVQLRFAYRQAPEQGTGYSHYYWGIDDVRVTSNDVSDDIEITRIVNGDVFNVFEYRVTPIEQAIVPGEGGLLAGVMYRNVGTSDQYDVEVMVEVLDSVDNVINTTTQVLDAVYTSANAPTCPANEEDTLYVATGWAPDSPGTYGLRVTMTADSADATPENNVAVKDIIYSDDIYGHDDEGALDGQLGARESEDINGYFDPTGYGSYYHCPNPGTMAYGLAIKFGAGCGLDIDGNPGELEFETRLYELDGSVGLTASPFMADYWIYDQDWTNIDGDDDVEVYLSFEDPIEMAEDAFYFAAVMNEYESPTELTVWAELNSDTDNSTGNFNQAGDGSFVWFTSQSSTPAVRLITSPRGCTDPLACNYGNGLLSNAECEYASCTGCTESGACNYNDGATLDDGTCDYACYGCTDSDAANWSEEATLDDGSCVYFLSNCDFIGYAEWEALEAGLYSDSALWHYQGVASAGEWVLSMPNVVLEPTSGSAFSVNEWSNLSLSNLPPGLESADLPVSLLGGEQACVSYAGIPSTEGVYPILVSGDLTVSLFGNPYSVGTFNVVGSIEIVPNPNPIPGCTYGNAANYLVYANQDDGTCEFEGCMEPAADNYQVLATVDDGSCEFEDCVSTCPGDLDGDGTVGTPDLLALLSSFGLSCE